MKFVARMFATMAVAFLLASPLRAGDTPKPGSTAKKDDAVSSRPAPPALAEAKAEDASLAPERRMPVAQPATGAESPATSSSRMRRSLEPAAAGSYSGDDVVTPKVELFLGYSYVRAVPMDLGNRIVDLNGGDLNLAINANRYFGLVADFAGYHASTLTFNAPGTSRDVDADGRVFTYMVGPRFSFRHPRFTPFIQALFGIVSASAVPITNCVGAPICTPLLPENVFAAALGGGLDWTVRRHVAVRVIQAEYLLTKFKLPTLPQGPSGGRSNMRLSAGLVFRFGGNPPPPPPSATCSLQPSEVFAGEPVTSTASGSNFNPKRTVTYNWNGTGVKVTGSDASAQIDTTGLQPGSYGVTANLSDGSKNGSATCSAKFTVKEPRPPVISCSAHPESVRTGGSSTINSNASSPDGRRLTYSYTASAAEISGRGDSATLNTQGVEPGRITVSCNVSDDRNPPLTASSSTIVNVEAPPPPEPAPAPATEIRELEAKLALHSIYFQTARPTVENPEGGLVDSQADILNTLAEAFKNYLKYRPEAHLILGGHADPRGTVEYNNALTERRVGRTKNYLVEHGVPSGSLETQSFGKQQNLSSDEVKQLIEENPDLSPAERTKLLRNLPVIVLANNRRVDVTLNTTGQQSVRKYPFNAKDSLTLLSTQGGTKAKGKKPAAKKPAAKKS